MLSSFFLQESLPKLQDGKEIDNLWCDLRTAQKWITKIHNPKFLSVYSLRVWFISQLFTMYLYRCQTSQSCISQKISINLSSSNWSTSQHWKNMLWNTNRIGIYQALNSKYYYEKWSISSSCSKNLSDRKYRWDQETGNKKEDKIAKNKETTGRSNANTRRWNWYEYTYLLCSDWISWVHITTLRLHPSWLP